MNIDLCRIDWVAIGAIASFAMIFVTWLSLRQMKRQWDEERRPRLNFSITISQAAYMFKISNLGRENAYNINLNFNQEFTDALSGYSKMAIEKLQTRPLAIEAGCSKYYFISACEEWKVENLILIIKGQYCGKYKVDEVISFDEYRSHSVVVNDALTTYIGYIKKGLITQNDSYYSIQKSLDIIAKRIDKLTTES